MKREYFTRVRKRVFIITTILAPLSIAVITLSPIFLAKHGVSEERIAIYDESGIFVNQLQNKNNVKFEYIEPTVIPLDTFKRHYSEQGYSGVLHIPSNFSINDPTNVAYFSNDQLGIFTEGNIRDQMDEVLRSERLKEANVSPEMMAKLNTPVEIVQPDLRLSSAETSTALAYVMGFMIYIVMLTYGMTVMRGVMEEKTNRIAEVIISSVKPFQLMMGKIVGIALVGLTQFLIWIVLSGIILSALKGYYAGDISQLQNFSSMSNQLQHQNVSKMASFVVDINKLPLGLIAFGFVFFFLGGYLLYASLFAAIGAAAGEEGDQSLTFVATVPIIISIIIMVSVLNQPNGQLALITSMIPFCSPVVMAARLPFVPPAWQIILSGVLLIAGFICMVWVAGKIYRTGILLYGKKVSVREMLKWVRY